MFENVSEERMSKTLNQICDVSQTIEEGKPRTYVGPLLSRHYKCSRDRLDAVTKCLKDLQLQQFPYEFTWPNATNQEICYKGKNLIVTKKGNMPKVLLGCHSDYCGGEGANDNCTGIDVLLEIARVMHRSPLIDDVGFAFFDLEEIGRLGSQHFIQRYESKLPQIDHMIAVDSIGDVRGLYIWDETKRKKNDQLLMKDGQILKSQQIMRNLQRSAEHTGRPIKTREFPTIASDHCSFNTAGVPTMGLISADYDAYALSLKDTSGEIRYNTANHSDDVRASVHMPNLTATARMLVHYLMTRRAA